MTPAEFWQIVSSHAMRLGAKFPELVAAQLSLESGFGQYISGKNNYAGLKGDGSNVTTKEFYAGQWVEIKAGFIDFPSMEACIEYLISHWYRDWKEYKGVNRANNRNDAAYQLIQEGYATDPEYAKKLISLMDGFSKMSPEPSIRLASAAKFFNGESHQLAAWNWLEEQLTKECLKEFAALYRATPAKPKSINPLPVPYFSQRDNISGTGYRECFSSSCAMIAAFYGKIKGDDEYNAIRQKYGDTIDANAQMEALVSLGLKPRFITNGSAKLLEQEIDAGRPVAVGWLHHGAVSAPSGGGHWSVVIGYTPSAFVHNDPYGEADMAQGNYVAANGGKNILYSRKNWLPRWMVDGGGWAVLVNK